jgi:hypothetical protein
LESVGARIIFEQLIFDFQVRGGKAPVNVHPLHAHQWDGGVDVEVDGGIAPSSEMRFMYNIEQ